MQVGEQRKQQQRRRKQKNYSTTSTKAEVTLLSTCPGRSTAQQSVICCHASAGTSTCTCTVVCSASCSTVHVHVADKQLGGRLAARHTHKGQEMPNSFKSLEFFRPQPCNGICLQPPARRPNPNSGTTTANSEELRVAGIILTLNKKDSNKGQEELRAVSSDNKSRTL